MAAKIQIPAAAPRQSGLRQAKQAPPHAQARNIPQVFRDWKTREKV
jgi:hypothetical protein